MPRPHAALPRSIARSAPSSPRPALPALSLGSGEIDHTLALKLQKRLARLSMSELERLAASNPELMREWAGELRAERDKAMIEANRLSTAIDRLILASRRSITRSSGD